MIDRTTRVRARPVDVPAIQEAGVGGSRRSIASVHAFASLVEGVAVVLAHAAPAGPVRQRLERHQHGNARRLGQGVELGPLHELEPAARQRTHLFDALLQGLRRAVRGRHKPPYRQPGLAAARAHTDLEADAGLPVSPPQVAGRH